MQRELLHVSCQISPSKEPTICNFSGTLILDARIRDARLVPAKFEAKTSQKEGIAHNNHA